MLSDRLLEGPYPGQDPPGMRPEKRITCDAGLAAGEGREDISAIAFITNRDGNREIYLMNSDGSNQHRLTNTPKDEQAPTWSPDGRRIAFVSIRNGNSDIYVMDADGGEVTRLTFDPAEDKNPAWR